MLKYSVCPVILLSILLAWPAWSTERDTFLPATELEYLYELYKHFHSNPELSLNEKLTAQRIQKELILPGITVTAHVGGHGLVAVLENGEGPTLMLRADMDALPVKEKTGLSYASKVVFKHPDSYMQPVMHACGHDIHMTVLTGVARQLVAEKNTWQGKLLFVFQPAEELGAGAMRMLEDGLFKRFGRPDYNIALHTSAELPAGTIGYTSGFAMANVDTVDILIHGVGGHGAYPHKTRDPVVIAASLVLQLQTIVSRELSPLKSAVITVGSIHGGSKHNIIGDEVKLQLTVRSYEDDTRAMVLQRIREMSEGVARTAGLPDELLPVITIKKDYTPSVYNDPDLVNHIVASLSPVFGEDHVVMVPPVMAGEDFARYGRVNPRIPGALLWLGGVELAKYTASLKGKTTLPALHSPEFAPLPRPTIDTGVKAMTTIVKKLLARPASH